MQQVFKNAVFHREPQVLKKRLLPLSCGHIYILMASESSYVIPGEGRSLISLAFAVGICSQTFEDALAWLKRPKLLSEVKRWGKQCRGLDFHKENQVFESYLNEYCIFPKRWSASKTPEPCQHPWPLLVVESLLDRLTFEQAWNMPLPMAISIWSAHQENQGSRNLFTDEDVALIAARDKLQREIEQQKKEKHNENKIQSN